MTRGQSRRIDTLSFDLDHATIRERDLDEPRSGACTRLRRVAAAR
jgi:hypothetical protein